MMLSFDHMSIFIKKSHGSVIVDFKLKNVKFDHEGEFKT